jgi:RNA polymerase sigma-70 factor (ECF subfamily)
MALEPYPEALLEGLFERLPEPLARHDPREAIRLAFVAALQLVAPGERAVLVLCDVAGFHPVEAAAMLGIDPAVAARALLRARRALDARLPEAAEPAPPPGSPEETAVLERFAFAFALADVEAIVALLDEDVRLRLPPEPLEHRGRAAARRCLQRVPYEKLELVFTRANADPAFLLRGPGGDGLLALTLAGERVAHVTLFRDPGALRCFGLTDPARPPR